MVRILSLAASLSFVLGTAHAAKLPLDDASYDDINCTIRESGANLNCLVVGREKTSMTSDDVTKFIDRAAIMAYITVKSRKGMERTFLPDPNAAQFKKLSEVKRNGSISEISRAKLDLFAEIEKKVIKLSDELDGQSMQADLVKFDASITGERLQKQLNGIAGVNPAQFEAMSNSNRNLQATLRQTQKQLETLRNSGEKGQCVPVAKENESLQATLSNILVAFQTPGTCMDNVKISKDADGSVDLKSLNGLGRAYTSNCVKR